MFSKVKIRAIIITIFVLAVVGVIPQLSFVTTHSHADSSNQNATCGGVSGDDGASLGAITQEPPSISKKDVKPKKIQKKKTNRIYNWKTKKKKIKVSHSITKGCDIHFSGTLVSKKKKVKNLVVRVINSRGKTLLKKVVKIKGKKCKLSRLNSIKAYKLKSGKYTIKIYITDKKKKYFVVYNKKLTVKKPKWGYPVKNPKVGDGWHCHCGVHGGRHYGWDMMGGRQSIYAAAAGTVVYAKYHHSSCSFGKLIIIYHGKGIYTYYCHCSKMKVKVGKKVKKGQKIGVTGQTGYAFGVHLHFETRKGPKFKGKYNKTKLLDKYTYKQFNPAKLLKKRK